MPLESFLLHIYQEDIAGMLFHPYEQISPLPELEFSWKIQFIAEQAFQDKDSFVLAAHPQASEEFDVLYDYPQPPFKPTGISSYVINQEAFPYSKLFWETRPVNDLDSEFNLQWDFALFINELEPIILLPEFENVPSTFSISLHIEDFSEIVSSGQEIIYIPSETGEIDGFINIENDVSNVSSEIVPLISLQNYPNPFNPATTISYYVKQEAEVNISIYNIKGQKVKTLINETKNAGSYNLEWNGVDDAGKKVSSGVYFYRLKTGDLEKVRKMILLK